MSSVVGADASSHQEGLVQQTSPSQQHTLGSIAPSEYYETCLKSFEVLRGSNGR